MNPWEQYQLAVALTAGAVILAGAVCLIAYKWLDNRAAVREMRDWKKRQAADTIRRLEEHQQGGGFA